jgi:hypothetical protein
MKALNCVCVFVRVCVQHLLVSRRTKLVSRLYPICLCCNICCQITVAVFPAETHARSHVTAPWYVWRTVSCDAECPELNSQLSSSNERLTIRLRRVLISEGMRSGFYCCIAAEYGHYTRVKEIMNTGDGVQICSLLLHPAYIVHLPSFNTNNKRRSWRKRESLHTKQISQYKLQLVGVDGR